MPATTNPLGVKGCGEAGCAGSLTSVMNAVVDALSEYGIRHIDMPATPERVWQAIQERAGRARDVNARVARRSATRMTPATDILTRIARERNAAVAGVSARAFRQPLLHPAAGAAVRLHPGGLRRELHRARSRAHRLQRRLGGAADAGRLPGRPHRRALMLIAGLLLGAGAFAVAGLVNSFWVFVAMFARARPRQHRLSPGRLRAAVRARRAGAA